MLSLSMFTKKKYLHAYVTAPHISKNLKKKYLHLFSPSWKMLSLSIFTKKKYLHAFVTALWGAQKESKCSYGNFMGPSDDKENKK